MNVEPVMFNYTPMIKWMKVPLVSKSFDDWNMLADMRESSKVQAAIETLEKPIKMFFESFAA
jgi:hypothetical protein